MVLPKVAHDSIPTGSAPAAGETAAGARDSTPPWALDLLVDSGLAAYLVLDGSKVVYASPALLALAGWASSSAAPSDLAEIISVADCERIRGHLASAGDRHRDICALCGANRAEADVAIDAATIQTAGGPRTVMLVSDVSVWMKGQARLQRLAFIDTLTGLANRALLYDRIEQAIAAVRRKGGSFAILLIDLDQFKPINDTHGHATGDLVLREAARRLQAAARTVDTVARLGGDEFVVLLTSVGVRTEARQVAERIIQTVTAPLAVQGLRLGVSVGIAIFPDDGSDADQLLACADGAMYDAKNRGGNRHAFADPSGTSERISPRIAWSTQYRIGIGEIDRQHEDLVNRMGALWEALNARQDRATLLLGLSEMTRELETHFATEAAHMDAHPYAGAAAHLADHVRALQAARSLAAHVDERSLALGIRFLYDWLLSHIQSYDAELSRARSD
jgi:diguanylate cyclase (GGDEF)-like protein/hemerythrin-like metal-binding protein